MTAALASGARITETSPARRSVRLAAKGVRVNALFSQQTIASRITELAREIREDAGSEEPLLIGILKGTTVFLADLMRAIPGDARYEFIDVVRDVADTETAEALEINFIAHFEMRNRKTYLLKDVVSTGVIETYLLAQLRQRRPKELKLVALLDRPELRTMPLEVDFRAFVAGEGSYVGYGLELDGRHGNLPYIARLR